MTRRKTITLAVLLASILTVLGWFQALDFKVCPMTRVAIWFPLAMLSVTTQPAFSLIALLQFPALTAAFVLATRRWTTPKVLAVLILFYAALVAAALSTL